MKKRHQIIKQISRRAKIAFTAYENIRPFQHQLISILEPQSDSLGININALTAILELFEEIKNTQDQITNRAKNALTAYEGVRPFQRELLKILEPQSDSLGVGLHALIEVLELFEEIKGTYDAAVGHAAEAALSEEEFWQDFIAVTTLTLNIGEIINTSPVLTAILSDAPADVLKAAIEDLPAKRKQIIRKALNDKNSATQ